MAGAEVDVAGAIALATGMGVEPATAATLLAACAEGIRLGTLDRKDREGPVPDENAKDS
jgi:hypothetical protein